MPNVGPALSWAIAWLPGQAADDGSLSFGGWMWRYDLEPVGDDRTQITLTYDWSAVPPPVRENIEFPPFDRQHLDNSLEHLAGLTRDRARAGGHVASP